MNQLLPLYETRGQRKRIWELDFLRGLAILLMVFDHLAYDLASLPDIFANWWKANPAWNELYRFGLEFYESTLRNVGHYTFAGLFFLMTGVSCALSRSNLRRGLELGLVALGITLATKAATIVTGIDMLIVFGILHCMTAGILLYALVRHNCKNDLWLLVVGSAIVLVGILIEWYDAPYAGTIEDTNFLEIVIGFKKYGADYFAFFPCGGLVLIGGYIGNSFYRDRKSLMPRLDGRWNRPVCFVGRHTLSIYVVHQFLIFAAIVIAGTATGLKFVI